MLLLNIIVFPQLLGILLYFRLGWAPRWLAAIAAALAPAAIFFWLAPILLFAGLREATPSGCGMPALAALFLLFAGTIIQLVLGVFTQGFLSIRRYPKAAVFARS